MKTYRVDPKEYEGKEPIAEGYKIFNWDWTGAGPYCYADGGAIAGSVHTVEGELNPCSWGLHFCREPLDCMNFKTPVQWMRYAKVSAFDEIMDAKEGKTVARTLRIDQVLTWDAYVNACREVKNTGTDGADGYGIHNGAGIRNGSGIRDGYGIYNGSGIYNAYYCRDCEGISRCILCCGVEGAKLMIFNRKVSQERWDEVAAEIQNRVGNWDPDFTNAQELKAKADGQAWEATPADQICGRKNTEAYADMPEELEAYIKSLPEYDAKIYSAITGRA